MIHTRGWTPHRWALELSYFASDLEYPWWRLTLQLGRYWWKWDRFTRVGQVGIREREHGR